MVTANTIQHSIEEPLGPMPFCRRRKRCGVGPRGFFVGESMPRDDWAKERQKDLLKKKPQSLAMSKGFRHKFEIPKGTVVSVCRENDSSRNWVDHKTRKVLRFYHEYKTDTCRGTSGAVIFKMRGYLILTRRDQCRV